jgi:hypothetical protein
MYFSWIPRSPKYEKRQFYSSLKSFFNAEGAGLLAASEDRLSRFIARFRCLSRMPVSRKFEVNVPLRPSDRPLSDPQLNLPSALEATYAKYCIEVAVS